MTELTFEKFPRISRLKRGCVITEKIDGTNAQIQFDEEGNALYGSRKRRIYPGDDNFGFAAWADENREDLFKAIGPGRHYGEWWGGKIQRGYGLESKRFSLFNTGRDYPDLSLVHDLYTTPVLFVGEFTTAVVDDVMEALMETGSHASPGFARPEGVIVYLPAARQLFKVTFEHDITGKPEV